METIIILQFTETDIEWGTGGIFYPKTCGVVLVGGTYVICCSQNDRFCSKFALVLFKRIDICKLFMGENEIFYSEESVIFTGNGAREIIS